MKKSFYYARKTISGILSGFAGKIQYNSCDGWVDVEDCCEDPWYICPVFKDGTRIPLPFFWEENGFARSYYFLQNIVLLFLRFSSGYKDACQACNQYVLAWEAWQEQ